jgi:hypothetical protein
MLGMFPPSSTRASRRAVSSTDGISLPPSTLIAFVVRLTGVGAADAVEGDYAWIEVHRVETKGHLGAIQPRSGTTSATVPRATRPRRDWSFAWQRGTFTILMDFPKRAVAASMFANTRGLA